VSEWDSATTVASDTMSARDCFPSDPEAFVFITVEHGPDQTLNVGFDELEHTDQLHVHVGCDISLAEASVALFESGAAVQQFGADYLISVDWIRRHALASEERSVDWERRFDAHLVVATDTGLYFDGVDALRARVMRVESPLADHSECRWLG
jgi:hypothetical protein